MTVTPGAHLVMIAFSALSEEEEVFERIDQIRGGRLAGEASVTARMLRSLMGARDRLGHQPTVDEYRELYRELKGTDDEIDEINRA